MQRLSRMEKKQKRKDYIHLDFPRVFGISLGEYRCNHTCRMCPMYNMPPKEDRYMTDEVLDRILEEIGDRVCDINVSAFGEPFQHPQAHEFLEKIRDRCPNAIICLASNGSLLNQDRCDWLIESGVDRINVSMDANSAETHAWLTGTKNFDRCVRNLEYLVEARNRNAETRLMITTHIIGIKELEHEFDAFVERWENVVDQVFVRDYGNWGGLVDENELHPAKEVPVPEERYPCIWPWYSVKIEPNGDVSKCFVHIAAGDPNPMGNILESSLADIWSGARQQALREAHLCNNFEGISHCDTCTSWAVAPNFWKRERQLGIFPTKRWA